MEEKSEVIVLDRDGENGIEKNSEFRSKVLIYGAIFIVVIIVGGLIFGKGYYSSYTKGSYSATDGNYKNKKFGFQLNVPISWKSYSVQEAVSCPTIRREYADDYYLIKSLTSDYRKTGFVIDKEALNVDYFTSSPLD